MSKFSTFRYLPTAVLIWCILFLYMDNFIWTCTRKGIRYSLDENFIIQDMKILKWEGPMIYKFLNFLKVFNEQYSSWEECNVYLSWILVCLMFDSCLSHIFLRHYPGIHLTDLVLPSISLSLCTHVSRLQNVPVYLSSHYELLIWTPPFWISFAKKGCNHIPRSLFKHIQFT